MKNTQRTNLMAAVCWMGMAIILNSASKVHAQNPSETTAATGTLVQVPASSLTNGNNFYLLSKDQPPLPCFPPLLQDFELPVYAYTEGGILKYLVDDRTVDYAAVTELHVALLAAERSFGLLSAEEGPPVPGEGAEGGEGGGAEPPAYNYGPDDLWLEITGAADPYAYLSLHGTVENEFYQLLSQTNLDPAGAWALGEILQGAPATNVSVFSPVTMAGTNQFFRAHHADRFVQLSVADPYAYESNAIIPTAQPGSFAISASSVAGVTVYYRLSGTASNGVDYTNLLGSVTIPPGLATAYVYVHPVGDTLLEGEETVVMTLVQTNDYLILPSAETASVVIKDSSTLVQVNWVSDAVEQDGPPGVAAKWGAITVSRSDERGLRPPITVAYLVAGSASNGTDYTALTGTVTFRDGEDSTNLVVTPVDDTLVEGEEIVTVTLIPTNTYAIDTNVVAITIADSSTQIGVRWIANATESHPASATPKETGKFQIFREDSRFETRALTVSYQLTGTAINGVDYTNMTGTVTIQANQAFTNIFIEPLYDDQLEGDETVKLTLTHIGDGYLVNPDFASATLTIADNIGTNTIQTVAHMNKPIGIDYHQPTDSLLVSSNSPTGEPNNFVRVFRSESGTNAVTQTASWSGVHGVLDEVKLVTVKTTSNGFTNGDAFFSSGTGIGWAAASGTAFNLNWCVLTNAAQTNALLIRGSLCQDQTGAFSNQVIAVTSPGGPTTGKKGVWRVDANRNPTLVANLDTLHLEGVIVLTNDSAQWGPWAGKIITGDEEADPPVIYTVATNGTVATNNTTELIAEGIHTEDFDLIPAGQDLYACDLNGNALLKVPRDYFTNYVGQLLITEGADFGGIYQAAKLFVLRWDAATTNFVTRKLLTFPHSLEHVTFAPVDLPPLTP